MRQLWNDECGAILTAEVLFLVTILVIGITVGLQTVRMAVTEEMAELGNAILALSQGYSLSGLSGCCADTEGSATTDTADLVVDPVCVAPIPSLIDTIPCSED